MSWESSHEVGFNERFVTLGNNVFLSGSKGIHYLAINKEKAMRSIRMKIIKLFKMAPVLIALDAYSLTFILADKKCSVTGSIDMATFEGSNTSTSCTKTGTDQHGMSQFICIFEGTKSSTKFEGVHAGSVVMMSSDSGSMKYLVDLKDKKYQMAQVRIILDRGLVMTKSCNGIVK